MTSPGKPAVASDSRLLICLDRVFNPEIINDRSLGYELLCLETFFTKHFCRQFPQLHYGHIGASALGLFFNHRFIDHLKNGGESLSGFVEPQSLVYLRESGSRLLMGSFTESFADELFAERTMVIANLHHLLKSMNRTPENTVLFLPLHGVGEKYREWLENRGETAVMRWVGLDFFERDILVRVPEGDLSHVTANRNSPKSKKFICLAARLHYHRIAVFGELVRSNILGQCHYSFLDRDGLLEAGNRTRSTTHFYLGGLRRRERDAFNTFVRKSPHHLDVTGGHPSPESTLPSRHISDSLLHIVLESSFSSATPPFLTEKTYKPILCFQPFVLFSNRGSLAALKASGYESFPEIFDETYDDIDDERERFTKICADLRRVAALSNKKIGGIVSSPGVQRKLIHNHELLMRRNRSMEMFRPFMAELEKFLR